VGTAEARKPETDLLGLWRKLNDAYDSYEREVRDLPCFEFRTTVVIELYRVRCPDCGVKTEKVPQLPSKAPFSKRFEEAVGLACESAAVRRVARQFGLASSTVRAIDVRYLSRWSKGRRKPALRQMGVDEIHLGKKQKFLTVVSNLETGEPLWFGRERKKETLDEFFEKHLSRFQRSAIRAACVDMWEPFRQSLEQWVPECKIIYDKFHILQHASRAVDEVRRAEFFRNGGAARDLVRGKRWLLLTSWLHLDRRKRRQLIKRPVCSEPAHSQSLPPQGESFAFVGFQLRRSHVALSAEMDRPVALAAAETHGETSPNVAGSSRGDLELLPDEGTDGGGGSRQRQHQSSAPSRPRLSRHELSAC
jgi:Transposase/Helix-turn-helix domain of transposase family ISL3/zinc-finger of transposase IS204/IS1001/IS1096/IS1165